MRKASAVLTVLMLAFCFDTANTGVTGHVMLSVSACAAAAAHAVFQDSSLSSSLERIIRGRQKRGEAVSFASRAAFTVCLAATALTGVLSWDRVMDPASPFRQTFVQMHAISAVLAFVAAGINAGVSGDTEFLTGDGAGFVSRRPVLFLCGLCASLIGLTSMLSRVWAALSPDPLRAPAQENRALFAVLSLSNLCALIFLSWGAGALKRKAASRRRKKN